MERSSVFSLLCSVTFAAGAVLLSSAAYAIPDNHSPLLAGTEAKPDFSGVTRNPAPEPHPVAAATATGRPASAAAPAKQSAAGIPCLSRVPGDEPGKNRAPNQACNGNRNAPQAMALHFGRRLNGRNTLLGELDGVRVDYRLAGGLTVKGVAGYPVVSDKDKFNAERQVYGVSANTGKFARAWDLNSYLLEQQSSGKVGNRELGGALRYLRPKRSLLLFVDYDVAQHTLGAFTTSGAWKLARRTTVSAVFDKRNDPIRDRQKKFLQHSMNATQGWGWILPSDRIRHLTSQHSDQITTLALGLTHTFSQRLAMSGSVAMLDASNDMSGSAATEGTSEYVYHLKFTGSSFLLRGDRNTIDLRHRVTDSSRASSAAIDTRYTLNRRWNVSPSLRADYRDNALDQSAEWVTSPSVKMEYHWREQYGFKIEAGGEWRSQEVADQDRSQSSYFVKFGYKAKF